MSMNTPYVSVVLPAYKQRFLAGAIKSILDQTYKNFELIVVDDNSPENLESVVRSFDDSRVSYVRNEKNFGSESVVKAWNHALKYACGEWCVLASDDDVYDANFLMEMTTMVQRYPMVDLAHCRLCCIDSDRNITRVCWSLPEYESQIEFVEQRVVNDRWQMAPDFMFRLSAMRKIGGFVDFPVAWYSDEATWNLLANNGVAASNKAILYWRKSGLNISCRTDLSIAKCNATLAYLKWLKSFVASLKPKGEIESFLLRKMQEDYPLRIEHLLRTEMKQLPFKEWVKLYKDLPVSARARKKIRRDLGLLKRLIATLIK